MAHVAICMIPEVSGINVSMALARRLTRRGHNVTYVTGSRLAGHLARNGMVCHLVAELDSEVRERSVGLGGALPWVARALGAAERVSRVAGGAAPRFKGWLKRGRRKFEAHAVRADRRRRIVADLDEWCEQASVDMLLLDPLAWWMSIPFAERGVPLVHLNPTPSAPPSLRIPPVFSPRVPSKRSPSIPSIANALDWVRHGALLRRRVREELLFSASGVDAIGPATAAGLRLRVHEYGLRLRAPQLLAWPADVDYPDAYRGTDTCHLGTCVDSERKDSGDLAWSVASTNRPLAFCSVGSLVSRDLRLPFYRVVAEAFRALPEWDLILVGGGSVIASDLPDLSANARLVDWAPQLELLKRAALFITNGGPGSVREAIHAGVPMLVFPTHLDTFGVSARLVYHGLAYRGDARRIEAAELSRLVRRAHADTVMRKKLNALREKLQPQAELDEGCRFIERRLRRR